MPYQALCVGENTRDEPDAATCLDGDAMRKPAFDPYSDPEFVRKNQHARIVVFSTACILVSLLVIGTFGLLLLLLLLPHHHHHHHQPSAMKRAVAAVLSRCAAPVSLLPHCVRAGNGLILTEHRAGQAACGDC